MSNIVPPGMNEDEFISILYEIGHTIKKKYHFGYHDESDMIQQGIEEILVCLQRGKFKPRGDKPLPQQFKNWVRVWMRNKLSNYRRKHSCRYANADSALNQSKFKIMHPLKIHSQGLTQSEIFARAFSCEDRLRQEDALCAIQKGLSVEQYDNFILLVDGSELPPETVDELFFLVKDLLCEEA
jgi:hypothetical protein